jgi:hypothetical protein
MFETTSRYVNLEVAELTLPDGRVIKYVRRRFLPPAGAGRLLVEVAVAPGDRLDLITARTLGDPEQFWRVCDANGVLHPAELTEEAGRTVRVTIPEVERP